MVAVRRLTLQKLSGFGRRQKRIAESERCKRGHDISVALLGRHPQKLRIDLCKFPILGCGTRLKGLQFVVEFKRGDSWNLKIILNTFQTILINSGPDRLEV